MRLALAAAVGALLVGGAAAHALRLPAAPHCPVFPASNAWNQRVDKLPVATNSAELIQSIGAGTGLHADFGSGLYAGQPIGIPFDVVTKATPRTRVGFQYADESDRLPYPVPKNVHIEGGRRSDGDRHALLVDRDACRLYELYALYPKPAAAGERAPVRAGASARTRCVPPAGPRPTPPDSPSSPGSPATTRSRTGRSTTLCASRPRGHGARTSIRRGTTRRRRTIRRCRRWGFASG
jgi:hypothetical protein